MGVHSKLSASGMYRWEACPGSVRLCEGVPSVTSAAAEEGTRVHELCEKALRGKPYLAPNPIEQEAIQLYVDTIVNDYVEGKSKKAFSNCLHIEHSFDLQSVFPGCFGTADCCAYDDVQRLLRVYDFKYGKTPVDPTENSQLLYYALGAAVTLKYPLKEVEAVIIQPRAKVKVKVRRWRFSASYLFDFEERLVNAARATEDPLAPLQTGRHCYFCPAKNICPAQLGEAMKQAKSDFDEVGSTAARSSSVDDIFA